MSKLRQPKETSDTNNITTVASGDVYDMNDGNAQNFVTDGDTWSTSWGESGNVWVTWNDGGGFTNSAPWYARGYGKLLGDPNLNTSTFKGVNLDTGIPGQSGRGVFNSTNFYGYHSGIYEQDGTLYDCVINADDPNYYGAFIKLLQGNTSWTNHLGQTGVMTPLNSVNTSMFYGETTGVIQYGQGTNLPAIDSDGQYLYFTLSFIQLVRVEKSKFPNLNPNDYEFFSGLDGSGSPIWSSASIQGGWAAAQGKILDLTGLGRRNGGPVNSAGPIDCSGIVYNSQLSKYITVQYSKYWMPGEVRDYTDWGAGLPRYHLMEADNPWGPYAEIGNFALWGKTVAPSMLTAKYDTYDGLKMWVSTSGILPGWSGYGIDTPWRYGFQYMPVYLSKGVVERYEAESAELSGGMAVGSSYPMASGGQYVSFPASGGNIDFNLTQNIADTGWHIITIHYTDPLQNANSISVYVNGQKARTVKLSINNSDNTSADPSDPQNNPGHEWANASYIYYLNGGTANTIELRCDNNTGDNASGVLVDYIDVSSEPTHNEGVDIAPQATVQASSGNGQNAVKGFTDYCTEWTANSAGNEWLQLNWDTPQTVNKVVLYDQASMSNQVLSGILTFSDGSSVPVNKLQNDGLAGSVVTFPDKDISWVKLTVTQAKGKAGLGEFMIMDEPNLNAPVPPGSTGLG